MSARDFDSDAYGLPSWRPMRWWVGWWRLWGLGGGWCPACYSSPPLKNCRVCFGTTNYPVRTLGRRSKWWDRFKREYFR